MKLPSMDELRFVSTITDQKDPALAARAAAEEAAKQLQGASCDAVFLFVSALYETDWKPILRQIRRRLGNPLLLGCAGGGILGGTQELEFTPALSLAAAHLPRVKPHLFRIWPEDLEEPQGAGFWIEKLGCPPAQEPIGILLPEPFSCDVTGLVGALNGTYPKMPLIGGLASGAERAGGNALFLNDEVIPEGAVGILLTGDIQLATVVSQGCRPIGPPCIVTAAQDNVILELASQPATQFLQKLYAELSPVDQTLARRALFVGIVMNEQKDRFQRGDFLIRNLIGMDPGTGAILIGDQIQVGQTVQFQVRDGQAAREDLQHLLNGRKNSLENRSPAGGLLFNCLGRGRDLYGEPHVDLRTLQAALGKGRSKDPFPIAGFFCNGEIGPVAGRNFIHGFTASLGLFSRKGPDPVST